MLIEILEPDFVFDDERGTLTQLVHDGYKQYNIIFSKKGAVRGDHYHKINNEAFYVIKGRFRFDARKEGIKETYTFSGGDMFRVPAYVIHSFYYEEDTLIASMYDVGVEMKDGTKDIYTEEKA